MKKVRLTVKLVLSDNFKKIIEGEERASVTSTRVVTAPTTMPSASSGSSLSLAKIPTQADSEESKFDKDDLVLKTSSDA